MSRRQLIVDTETTGLFAESGHRAWEFGAIEYDTGREHLWRVEADLAAADPEALEVCRYHERTAGMIRPATIGVHDLAGLRSIHGCWSHPAMLAAELARLLAGVTIVGAIPGFDERMLAALLADAGLRPPWPWHYRVRDIGSMAYGYLTACLQLDAALGVPSMDASTDDFAQAFGVDPEQFDRHSALGDCRLVAAMLAVIEGKPGVQS